MTMAYGYLENHSCHPGVYECFAQSFYNYSDYDQDRHMCSLTYLTYSHLVHLECFEMVHQKLKSPGQAGPDTKRHKDCEIERSLNR